MQCNVVQCNVMQRSVNNFSICIFSTGIAPSVPPMLRLHRAKASGPCSPGVHRAQQLLVLALWPLAFGK